MRRFFADNSFWNIPLERNAPTDPNSDSMLEVLRTKSGEGDRGFWINLHKWTIPVYEVDESTPRHTVLRYKEPYNHGTCFENPVPIPDHALPDPLVDSHIALVDWKNMKAWDTWYTAKGEDGQWRSNTGMTYRLDGSGVFNPEDFPANNGESIHSYGPSRAAGVPSIAGLIMQEEILEGKIEHKLAFATCAGAFQEFVYPACWTDGQVEGGLPEGCIIQLDPDLDLDRFDLKPAARVIAKALQEYGAVNVDCCGGKTLYGEGLYHHPSKKWDGILDESDLTSICLSHYRVLKLGEITYKGHKKKR